MFPCSIQSPKILQNSITGLAFYFVTTALLKLYLGSSFNAVFWCRPPPISGLALSSVGTDFYCRLPSDYSRRFSFLWSVCDLNSTVPWSQNWDCSLTSSPRAVFLNGWWWTSSLGDNWPVQNKKKERKKEKESVALFFKLTPFQKFRLVLWWKQS